MKIKMEVEIDTDNNQDLNTIEELIAMLRNLAENYYEDWDAIKSNWSRTLYRYFV